MVDLTITRRIQEAVLRRWSASEASATLALRGGLLTGHWVGRHRRNADDVDFLANYAFDPSRTVDDLLRALRACCGDGVSFETASTDWEIIFAETEFPGVRLSVCVLAVDANADAGHSADNPSDSPSAPATHCAIQIDVGYNDPVSGGLISIEFETEQDTLRLQAPPAEVGFAWKLHGLVERDDGSWRPKDLADLLLINRHVDLHADRLVDAIRTAFASRDAPFWRLDRLMHRSFGSSRLSRKSWSQWKQRHPESDLTMPLALAVDEVARIVEPFWAQLRIEDPTRWPVAPGLNETLAAISGEPDFAVYDWPNGQKAIVYERQSSQTFPDPRKAATGREFRRRQILRECRGLTFNRQGNVVARPFPKFFNVKDVTLVSHATAFEKLDGSLVFPTPDGDGWLWRTRRGRSPIADDAGRYAEASTGDYRGLVAWCLDRQLTPLFEWCSNSRRIVLDHPVDRLVLTAIRRNEAGTFLPRSEAERLADVHGLEIVRNLGVVDDPQRWQQEVSQWTDREGCVLYCADHGSGEGSGQCEIFKFKAERYRQLHRAVEGPSRDRARWTLILDGARETLCETSAARGLPLAEYVEQFDAAIRATIEGLHQHLAALPDRSAESRKQLAQSTGNLPGILRKVLFAAFEGFDSATKLKKMLRQRCCSESQFREAVVCVGGPTLNDG